jgi:hypothetical protein
MDAQGFLAALAPAMTDAQARERFLAEPKAVLAAAGLDLPEWFTVTAREGDAPELTITVPGLLDPDADLSDADLETASGGGLLGDLGGLADRVGKALGLPPGAGAPLRVLGDIL